MTLTGRRIALTGDGKLPSWWYEDLRPGDYCGPVLGYTGDLPMVTFLKPNARDPDAPRGASSVQHVTSPPHTFTEEDDGTLTIAASISEFKASDTAHEHGDGWHGYLEHGVWRKV